MVSMTTSDITAQRDLIIETILPDVAFDGWVWGGVEAAVRKAGFPTVRAKALFPGGLSDVLSHFADYNDRKMLAVLENVDSTALPVRERVRQAVMARFEALSQNREAEKRALRYWTQPLRAAQATQIVWRTADRIWTWAGDTATDYNRYTKRGLLSGILVSTTLVWADDNNGSLSHTDEFLRRRIENVMKLGGILGKLRKRA